MQAHQRCLDARIPAHRKHCARHEDLLVRALADRAARLSEALSVGAAVSPTEISDRCAQLHALRPTTLEPARCLAALAWARPDRQRADRAFTWALALPASNARDVVLAQAAATLLHGLGDVDATRTLLARVPEPGPQLARIATSLQVFQDKLAPRQTAAHEQDTPEAWRSWLVALADAELHALSVREADRAATSHAEDAGVLQTAASVVTRAAAAVPPSSDRAARRRRIRALLQQARDHLQACASLPGAPASCATARDQVQAQLDQLATVNP